MKAGTPRLLVLAWLAAIGIGLRLPQASAQLPSAPVPVAPPGAAPVILGRPLPATYPAQPAGPIVPPVFPGAPTPAVPLAPPPPAPGPAPLADPGRDGFANVGLPSKPEGLFFDVELAVLGPAVRNQLTGTVAFPDGSTDTLHVPRANLSWTIAPRFDVGYRLAYSLGEFSAGYRFLVTDGRGDQSTSFGDASVKSRLDVNQIDLDYRTATYSPLPRYDLKYTLGVRIASIYIDSQASNSLVFQQASSYFSGAGPHAAIDFERHFKELPELGLFVRVDGAVMVGMVKQKFRETLNGDTINTTDGFFSQQRTQTSPTLTLQTGFTYHPLGIAPDRFRITGGYEFERWWGIGKISDSRADVTAQGVFLRAEWDY